MIGGGANDTLITSGTTLDLSSTAAISVETLKAGGSNATLFTLDQADLAIGGSVIGAAGVDTLSISSTQTDLRSTTLSSVEILKVGTTGATTFLVDQNDLAVGGTVQGGEGIDTLSAGGASLDLSSTTLGGVEVLKAGTNASTAFVVDQADLSNGGSVIGGAAADSLSAAGTLLDLTSTTLNSVETLKTGASLATTFIVDQADLAASGSVAGGAGSDTLIGAGSALDLTSTNLTSVETIKAGVTDDTTFNVDTADLAAVSNVTGNSGNDTIAINGSLLDLSSVNATSIEILKANTNSATTFAVGQADLAVGGSVIGAGGNDSLQASGTLIDLTSTTLSSVEAIKAGLTLATTFIVDQSDLLAGGSVTGNSSSDTLILSGTQVDLRSTTLNSVETVKGATSNATTFTVDQADLIAGGSIVGSSSRDTLIAAGTSLDLRGTGLSSVEVLRAGVSAATTFTVDQADLASGGTVQGGDGVDTLAAGGTLIDLTSTTLNDVEKLGATLNLSTTFIIDQADLAPNSSVTGLAGADTLQIAATSLDLTSATLSSVDILKAGTSLATTFTIDQADLAAGGSVVGGGANDTLLTVGATLNLASTTLSGVEILKAGTATDTIFTVDQGDLVVGGSVVGGAGNDTVKAAGSALDLTSTTLSSVEVIAAGSTAATLTVDQSDLANGGSVVGGAGSDTLAAGGTLIDLTSTTLSSVEAIAASSSLATTFVVDQADLATSGSVVGAAGTDTLVINGVVANLASTALSSVEIIKAGASGATTFTVDQADLAAGGSIAGGAGSDVLNATGASLDLRSTGLSSVETIKGALSTATTFTVDQADLAAGGSVVGSTGLDTLVAGGTLLDLSSTALSSVEILKAGSTLGTEFVVNQSDLALNGSIIGGAGSDTITAAGTLLDLGSTTVSSIEIFKAGSSLGTTFRLDLADLAPGATIIGGAGDDTLYVNATAFNPASYNLVGIEHVILNTTIGTTFTINQSDVPLNNSYTGTTAIDTGLFTGVNFDTRTMTFTNVEVLKANNAAATTFTVDADDLAAGGSVIGNAGVDTLTVDGGTFDLRSTTVSSIEILKGNSASGVTFLLDQGDLAANGSIVGAAGTDTLKFSGSVMDLSATTLTSIENVQGAAAGANLIRIGSSALGKNISAGSANDILEFAGTGFDLSATTISSIEILRAGISTATTFSVNQADLAVGGSVVGSSGVDTLTTFTGTLDLTNTTLSSVEIIKTGLGTATTFVVNQSDLMSGGSVIGNNGSDTLLAAETLLDLSSTTLSQVETIRAGSNLDTTFKIDEADLQGSGLVFPLMANVTGNSGTDTLGAVGTSLDVSCSTLTSVEILRALSTSATTLTVNQADLAANGSVIGGVAVDTLRIAATQIDLTSTTLSSMEIIAAKSVLATSFKVDQEDLLAGGSVVGNAGADTLFTGGSIMDLTSTTLSNVEILKVGTALGFTTIVVDQADLANGCSVLGGLGGGTDTLVVNDANIDLTSTLVASIEYLQAGSTVATTFTVDQADLNDLDNIVGTDDLDTLIVNGATFNLSATALSSVEILKAGVGAGASIYVTQADLMAGGSVIGGAGIDALYSLGTQLDLSSTTLSSIEQLRVNSTSGTTLLVDQADLLAGGSVIGQTGTDTLGALGTLLDLRSTTLSGIERLTAASGAATTFRVDQADLASTGSGAIIGAAGADDTLIFAGSALDLGSTTLSSVEILRSNTMGASLITVDQADLIAGGTVMGGSGVDTLAGNGAGFDLRSTTLSSVEIIQTTRSLGAVMTVDMSDLVANGSVVGGAGADTLQVANANIDLHNTKLTSVETLRAGLSTNTVFTVTQSHLAAGGAVVGSSGNDTLATYGTVLDLSATGLGSVEILAAAATDNTTFKVDQIDLLTGGSVAGNIGNDTLTAVGTQLDLRSTTLSSVETIASASAAGTTFTVDAADLATGGTVMGGSGADILAVNDVNYDLSSTSLVSVETLKAGATVSTTFTVDQADLANGGAVIGLTGPFGLIDTLQANGTTLDLRSTTLSSVEILKAGSNASTEFLVDKADLGTTVIGGSSADTLSVNDSGFNLSSVTLSSVEILKAGAGVATTFTVDANDLAVGGSVFGGSGADTLTINGASFDLTSTSLSSVETLRGGATGTTGTTFSVDQADLMAGGSVIGSTTGSDTLRTGGTALDLRSTVLTSIENLVTFNASGTTFTIDGDGAGLSITGGAGDDVFRFATGYGQTNFTNSAAILAQTATLANFNPATNDIIDVSALTTHGVASLANQATVQAAVDAGGPPVSLAAAISAAAHALDGSVNSQVAAFQYQGDTYVMVDNSDMSGITNNDVVIKLTGAQTLSASDFIL